MSRLRPERVRAYAKVNLDLRVLGRRPDGYHEIRTIFQTIALHDTLWFSPARGPLRITSTSPDLPAGAGNIVWKAARSIWRASGRAGDPRGVSVRIVKRIPMQAGLGGGSSDAAAALVALNRLWNAGLSPADLHRLAAALGSDVPFFLLGGTALGVERGDVIFPLPDLPPRPVVVVQPRDGVSTAAAYAWLAAAGPGAARRHRLAVPWAPHGIAVCNDFERVVFTRLRAAARLPALLRRAGAELAMLSGSGSAVFGLFTSERDARRAAGLVRASAEGVWVTRLKGRSRRGGAGASA